MSHTIKMFLKFGSYDHMLDLYENGTIFLNTIEYFRKLEDQELRGDVYEGASKVINSLPGTFQIPNVDRKFHYIKIHLKESYETILGNLYCLYCISSFGIQNPKEFTIDERNTRFGSHCVMIKDNPNFLKSIERVLRNRGLKYYHGFVKYYDKEKVSKTLSLFEKPDEFEYQKEFRFYVINDVVEPIKIQIGSLKGKAELYTAIDLLSLRMGRTK